MSVWGSVAIAVGNTALSVAGSLALKQAVSAGAPVFAVLGCMAWAGTALGVLLLLDRSYELGRIALYTQSLGLIAVLVLASLLYGEPFTLRRGVALALILIGLALAS